jgi:hypothetical protein
MAVSFKSNMPPKQSITAGMNVLFLLFLVIIFLFFHLSSIPGYGMGNSVWSQLLLFETSGQISFGSTVHPLFVALSFFQSVFWSC